MGLSNILREYLIKISYEQNEASKQKLVSGLKDVGKAALELGAAIEAAAAAVIAGVSKMSESMEQFYFAAQRTKSTVTEIKSLGYAFTQVGVGAEAAYGAMENIASFIRNNPGAKDFLRSAGVQGDSDDPAKILTGLGAAFAKMPIALANAYAQVLGLDERTMLALRNGVGDYVKDYESIVKRVGVNQEKAAAGAHAFMVQLRKVETEGKVFSDYILQLLSQKTGVYVDNFRVFFERNFTRIADAIATGVTWVLRIADAIVRLSLRAGEALETLYDKFRQLPVVVQEVLAAVTAAFLIFESSNPALMAITALSAALLLLYDDYKTWKEGGKHLVDWKTWTEDAAKAKTAMGSLGSFLKESFTDIWFTISQISSSTYEHAIKPIFDKIISVMKFIQNSWLGRKIAGATGSEAAAGFYGSELGATLAPSGQYEIPRDPRFTEDEDAPSVRSVGRNNFGNMRDKTGNFISYNSPAEGAKALRDYLIRRYADKGLDSIRKIFEVYAPRKDHNDTDAYEKNVSGWTGFGIDQPIDLHDARTMAKMMMAITRQEGRPLGADAVNAAAGLNAVVHQSNTYNINGATDPKSTAAAIGTVQNQTNQQLTRSFKNPAQ